MEPPADPEDWTDEQWLLFLQATDVDHDTDGLPDDTTRPPGRTASVLGRAMLGLEEALFGPRDRDEVVIVASADEPTDLDGIELHLDPDEPRNSWARIDPDRRSPPGLSADEPSGD